MVKYQRPEMQVESIKSVDVIMASGEMPQVPTQVPTAPDGGAEI